MSNLQYEVKSPVLFLIFNRPDVTALVFEQIKKVKPAKLYVAADGARKNKENEVQLCQETRAIINQIDWNCEVKTLFRDENLGCKYAVSSAISWFFENEVEGIILEDDCLPQNDFFVFCDTLLEKYRNVNTIKHIGGCNFQFGKKFGNESYYFSNLTHVWGWASWRRVWNDYDVELNQFKSLEVKPVFKSLFENEIIVDRWFSIYNDLLDKKIDTWDYQLAISNMINKGLTIIPNVNLIKNIGFGAAATHTFDTNDSVTKLEFGTLEKISHPDLIEVQKEADFFTLNREFQVELIQKKRKKKQLINKLKFWKK
ncbi:nucleotide-diphospho-sugar transferase [Flavobacterium sp. SUN052]|uniref:nucleotide-diphospho-sugar transferase n=1 Tax=Flavobacterium sp. SUN052 TaxID=3002441 RepID=UPI00237E8852|nr:nucleotide-diphospho-sugar transferase [Flavobacterium sp. SUN052]MEC4005359.1 nucleotide-diphospho-sugar transferase [Flavobacterium sp. SUN052]